MGGGVSDRPVAVRDVELWVGEALLLHLGKEFGVGSDSSHVLPALLARGRLPVEGGQGLGQVGRVRGELRADEVDELPAERLLPLLRFALWFAARSCPAGGVREGEGRRQLRSGWGRAAGVGPHLGFRQSRRHRRRQCRSPRRHRSR